MTPRRKALIGALEDPDAEVRSSVAEALDRLDAWEGLAEAVAKTKALLKTDWLRLLASLSGRRDETTLKLGLRALDHPEADVRLAALDLVAACADLRACPVVSRRLADPSPLVRGRASEVLAGLGDRRRGDEVAALLDDPDPEVLAQAAASLGLLDHVASEPRLLALLAHPAAGVRASAAEALGRLGG